MLRGLAAAILWLLMWPLVLAGGLVDATTLGFSTDPDFDNTPAWNALIANGPDGVYFDGKFYFKSQPDQNNRVLRIEGVGVNGTTFYRDFTPASQFDALISSTKALHMSGFGIIAVQGTDGIAVELTGLGASASTLRDLYVSAQTGASWAIPLKLWSDNVLGIRGVLLDNIELFAATVHGFWFVNVRGLTAGVQYYPAGGTVDHAVIQNNNAERSSSIDFETRHLVELYVYGTDSMVFKSVNGTNVIVSPDSTNIRQIP